MVLERKQHWLALVISACCLQGRCPEEFVTGGTVLAVAGLHPRSRQFQDVTRVPNVLVQSLNRLVDEKSLLHQNMFALKVTRCVEGNKTNTHICFEPESAGFFAPPTSRGVMRMLFFSIHLDQHLSSSLFGYVARGTWQLSPNFGWPSVLLLPSCMQPSSSCFFHVVKRGEMIMYANSSDFACCGIRSNHRRPA